MNNFWLVFWIKKHTEKHRKLKMSSSVGENVILYGVKDIARCKQTCGEWLQNGAPLAVDCEGQNLGATGRLTLIQVATGNGNVYIFDVMDPSDMENREAGARMLSDSGLKEVLESSSVLKIFHSCHGDAGALFHQFGIKLQNIFDTQAAHLAIEVSKGARFPFSKGLALLVEIYLKKELDTKTFQDEWLKDREIFWARRPLSAQALQYAAGDVSLLQDMYEAMNRILDSKPDSWQHYKTYLDFQMNEQIENERVVRESEALKKRNMEEVFQEMDKRLATRSRHGLQQITENEKRAYFLFRAYVDETTIKESDFLHHKIKIAENLLIDEISAKVVSLKAKGEYELEDADQRCLRALANHSDEGISKRMKPLLRQTKVLVATKETKELIARINSGHVSRIDNMTQSDMNALEKYREFSKDIGFQLRVPSLLPRLEMELNRRNLLDWEALDKAGTLGETATIQTQGVLRHLSRHTDLGIQNRAKRLSKAVTIFKTKQGVNSLIAKSNTSTLSFQALHSDDKWVLQRVREHKAILVPECRHPAIVNLENQMNSVDLDTFEAKRRAGGLRNLQNFEKAIIHSMVKSANPSISRRASVLREAMKQPRRPRYVEVDEYVDYYDYY